MGSRPVDSPGSMVFCRALLGVLGLDRRSLDGRALAVWHACSTDTDAIRYARPRLTLYAVFQSRIPVSSRATTRSKFPFPIRQAVRVSTEMATFQTDPLSRATKKETNENSNQSKKGEIQKKRPRTSENEGPISTDHILLYRAQPGTCIRPQRPRKYNQN